MDGYEPDNPYTYRSGGQERMYLAEDDEQAMAYPSFSEDETYEDFVEEFGHEPLRILDVTEADFESFEDGTVSYTDAIVVWEVEVAEA